MICNISDEQYFCIYCREPTSDHQPHLDCLIDMNHYSLLRLSLELTRYTNHFLNTQGKGFHLPLAYHQAYMVWLIIKDRPQRRIEIDAGYVGNYYTVIEVTDDIQEMNKIFEADIFYLEDK